jgi:hypothetical protein
MHKITCANEFFVGATLAAIVVAKAARTAM